ncbi:MAG: aminopeptidase [Syntrophobacterales bacterium]|nr:MAG: aminopeptidase [Syntrophobacterales bacterium]
MPNGKRKAKPLEDILKLKGKLAWDRMPESLRKECFLFAEEYKSFLDHAKTEREAVDEVLKYARERGFRDITGPGRKRRIYWVNKNKNMALAILGKRPFLEGMRIIVSHIDSPRLDLKQNPLYEELEIGLLRTHYYGGIKKYQWVATPLALHGTMVKRDGTQLTLRLGEEPGDPVFTVCDLMPHLSRRVQDEKKLREAIQGEKLTILAGSIPFPDEDAKERIKLNILDFLYDQYGLVEEDFLSAELELIPAHQAREVGFDKSLVGAYGQDDRLCAYASLRAIDSVKAPEYSIIALFLDKEEIGSEGNTSAKSKFLEWIVVDLLRLSGEELSDMAVRQVLFRSKALSADVDGAMDPNYQDVHEKQNAAKIGYGVCLSKFTGSGGKYASSDASAEYVAEIRKLFNDHQITWQMAELGKVDEGGGGTLAKYLASYGMDIIDCGAPLLGMHSPFEVASKVDIYETFRAYKVFLGGKL